ncbi:tetratricopeptide repeat-containing glycosyltransferase family protein [Conservatibacter flavescens]|uniref:Uncharacterized protein n=1 Tax=Conservatibacter flavescens TaxID=28161 RepID=A0A2M8S102_9PAST|nr:tetratricopeptide repeat-containing glycosyltransferase family protein [Conservatibacter flavescens]PJG84832.1 hypothetical protein CVP05_09865 [Conservatibacter flavescens]
MFRKVCYAQQLAAKNSGNINLFHQAIRSYTDYLEQDPQNYGGYHNRSELYHQFGYYDKAMKDLETSLSIKPNFSHSLLSKSLILLRNGNYKEGWELFEQRRNVFPEITPSSLRNMPYWKGETFGGSGKLLIFTEQGFGDAIHFARYIPMIVERYKNVDHIVLQCDAVLVELFKASYPNIHIIDQHQKVENVSYIFSLMSAPALFETIPNNIPFFNHYLTAPLENKRKWQSYFQNHFKDKVKVGICWTSSRENIPHHRNLQLNDISHLFNKNAEFFCLQPVIPEYEQGLFSQFENLHHFPLNSFADTAGLIEQMDLVITVDTSAAHLAGALGKKTWLLLGYHADFRWLLNRDDSIWYSSMKLFRQTKFGDWSDVFNNLSLELNEFCCVQSNR